MLDAPYHGRHHHAVRTEATDGVSSYACGCYVGWLRSHAGSALTQLSQESDVAFVCLQQAPSAMHQTGTTAAGIMARDPAASQQASALEREAAGLIPSVLSEGQECQ